MKMRPINMDVDSEGIPFIRVPIASTGHEAVVDLKDWERLIGLGYYGNVWGIKTPKGRVYPMLYSPSAKDQSKRKATTLARAVLGGLGQGEKVYHLNGDDLDCRRHNLGIKTSKQR